eukprot:4012852-Pyramimonas_sp.AAC.1
MGTCLAARVGVSDFAESWALSPGKYCRRLSFWCDLNVCFAQILISYNVLAVGVLAFIARFCAPVALCGVVNVKGSNL